MSSSFPRTESLTRIRVLPSDLVNQIAAGEVVERPASVVKELLENSIDAGSTSIDVILEQGGRKLIEVIDNGSGMSESDARLSLERHATSKIARFEDLLGVSTLGFRGEALPSIASVSRFSMVTWDGASPHAVEIDRLASGEIEARPAARSMGTTIRVAELFESVPARRKFLKSADAEFRAIIGVLSSYAVISPELAIRLTHNGRIVLDLPCVPTLRDRALQILGPEAEAHLAEIAGKLGRCEVSGFVTRGIRYGSRRNQFFFVNGRLVRDRVLTHAASRASDAYDFDGHPAIILFLRIDPELVDVNVHPAKTEVRFRDSSPIHVVVEDGIRRALGGPEDGRTLIREPVGPAGSLPLRSDGSPGFTPASSLFEPLKPESPREIHYEATPLFHESSIVQPPPSRYESRPGLGSLHGRVIGQYRDSYILIDSPEGLRVIDQHAAHERVLYDRLDSTLGAAGPQSQSLLEPAIYEAGAPECGILESHLDELRSVGFEIERFSGNSFAISAVPSILARERLESFFSKLIDDPQRDRTSHLSNVRHRVVASLACQAAIKVHRPLGGHEMSQLVADVMMTSNPFACPHGRPVIVDIRQIDIEKHFHRR